MSIRHSMGSTGRGIKKALPVLLSVAAASGVVLTAIFVAKETPKANAAIKEKEIEKGEKLTKVELVKTVAKPYMKSSISCAVTVSCIIGSAVLSQKRLNNITAAYIMLDQSYRRYKHKVKALLDSDKVKEIKTSLIKDEYTPTKVDDDKKIYYFDGFGFSETDCKFMQLSDHEIKEAELEINREVISKGYVSLDFVRRAFKLDGEGINDLGWSINTLLQGHDNSWLDFLFESITMEDGMEVISVSPGIPASMWYQEQMSCPF